MNRQDAKSAKGKMSGPIDDSWCRMKSELGDRRARPARAIRALGVLGALAVDPDQPLGKRWYRPGRDEEGGALAFVLVVMAAVMFVASFGLKVGLENRRASVRTLHGRTGLACAETAMQLERGDVALNKKTWNTVLAGGNTVWYPSGGISGNCSAKGNYSYKVTIRDNVDEVTTANDPKSDIDDTVIIDVTVSRGSYPVASLSSIVHATTTDAMGDYTKQSGSGARKLGNQ